MPSAAHLRADHAVHFYDDEQALAALVVPYLASALADGGAAVSVSAADHRRAFDAEFERLGVDAAAAEHDGSLTFLDARQTLDRLLVDGAVDADRFDDVIAGPITALARQAGRVHAFGEMVGLLWQVGDIDGVVVLEDLWNDLQATCSFSLLCAYPSPALASPDAALLICDSHTAVSASVPSLPDAHATRAFPATPLAPARVRAFVSHVINGTALNGSADGMHDDLALVATELAVNAIRHAESPFTVSLAADDDRIRIIVGDTDPQAPRRRAPDVQDESGRGLLLVDALADAWGADPVDGGKLVWAELARRRPSQG